MRRHRDELMATNDQSRIFTQGEDNYKKQIAYLTDKVKEYRDRGKDTDILRLENENLKIRAMAASTLESSSKNLVSEIENLRSENSKQKVKIQALLAENGTLTLILELMSKHKNDLMMD